MIYYNYHYGAQERQCFDLTIPEGVANDTGLAFFIHGGGYICGSKDEYKDFISRCAEKYNVAYAAVNYRYASDETGIDEIIEDITSALQVIRSLAVENGINITKMILNGASAGGHLALLYAYKHRETSPVRPVGVVSFCGVTDYTDVAFYGRNMAWYREPDNWDEINNLWSRCFKTKVTEKNFGSLKDYLNGYSPVYYVNKNTVPTAIYHGNSDMLVPYSNAVMLDSLLEKAGVTHKFVTGEGVGHNIFEDREYGKKAWAEVENFIETYLK